MKLTTPSFIPTRSDFMGELLYAVFPHMEKAGLQRNGYGYSIACRKAAIDLGMLPEDFHEDIVINQEDDLFSLMIALSQARMHIFETEAHAEMLTSGKYRIYSNELGTFCDDQNGSLKNWLKDENRPIRKGYEVSVFFSYLLAKNKECLKSDGSEKSMSSIDAFTAYCLTCLGISEIDEPIQLELSDHGWKTDRFSGVPDNPADLALFGRDACFSKLTTKSIKVLAAAIMTIVGLLGENRKRDEVEKTILKFHEYFQDVMREEIETNRSIEYAELALMNCVKVFEPRSIQVPIGEAWSPLDFFVEPDFYRGATPANPPLSGIPESSFSRRHLLAAKTGTGKTMYLQTSALRLLQSRFDKDRETTPDNKAGSGNYGEPILISVPAKMFTYCFRSGAKYRSWTSDFVELFFNCMWKLYPSKNFFSKRDNPGLEAIGGGETGDYRLTKAMARYLRRKAESGELIAIFDSFDEVASGAERDAFVKALAAFYDGYCKYPEQDGKVGAHVVISSREMSPDTMARLRDALELNEQLDIYGIHQLSEEKQAELIRRWKARVERHAAQESSEYLIEKIQTNHFLQEYAVNPYMLSVVCYDSSLDLSRITQTYIASLVQRMSENNSRQDWTIQSVLRGIEKVLQELAVETIVRNAPHFSTNMLDSHLRNRMDIAELSEDQVDAFLEKLHEIFVTEVGLIVPADGDDESYQFINDPIRFELAARGLQRTFEDDEKVDLYRYKILPYLDSVADYVGLIVPLLCDIKKENVQLAELLSFDLAMRDFANDREEDLLLRAMLDLILARYSLSVLNLSDPGATARSYVLKAQRVLMMRLLSSSRFNPTEEEASALLHTPSYRNSEGWIRETIKAVILEKQTNIP